MSQTEKNSEVQNPEVVKNQILAMYNSKEYQELAAYYNKPTFFEILGIKRSEDRNTNFLSWLLNDKSSHGLGILPFNKFLRMLAINSEDENNFDLYKSLISGQYNIENLDIQVQKDCEIYKSKGANGRDFQMDMFIKFDIKYNNKENTVCIVIENKIGNQEERIALDKIDLKQTKTTIDEELIIKTNKNGKTIQEIGQTALYAYDIKQQQQYKDAVLIGVYLAPKKPKSPCEGSKVCPFIQITYKDFLDAVIEPLLSSPMPDDIKMLLNDYIKNLGTLEVNEQGKNKSTIANSEFQNNLLLNLFNKYGELFNSAIAEENKEVSFYAAIIEDPIVKLSISTGMNDEDIDKKLGINRGRDSKPLPRYKFGEKETIIMGCKNLAIQIVAQWSLDNSDKPFEDCQKYFDESKKQIDFYFSQKKSTTSPEKIKFQKATIYMSNRWSETNTYKQDINLLIEKAKECGYKIEKIA